MAKENHKKKFNKLIAFSATVIILATFAVGAYAEVQANSNMPDSAKKPYQPGKNWVISNGKIKVSKGKAHKINVPKPTAQDIANNEIARKSRPYPSRVPTPPTP